MDLFTLDHRDGNLLMKRDCVTDCVVPSCSSLRCNAGETCILSSQTCSSCPAVSCVSLSLTTTATHNTSSVPRGAIAGISVAVLLLLLAIIYLIVRIRSRRRLLAQINSNRSGKHRSNVNEDDDMSMFENSRGSTAASIHIGLDSDLVTVSPGEMDVSGVVIPPSGHFFSADELLRMSYAETSRPSSILSYPIQRSESTHEDAGAAIIQANNPITAVRAKAAVLQIHRGQPSIPNLDNLALPQPGTQSRFPVDEEIMKSTWEDDDESIQGSPIERDYISPSRFGTDRRVVHTEENLNSGVLETPTKPRLMHRSLTETGASTEATNHGKKDVGDRPPIFAISPKP